MTPSARCGCGAESRGLNTELVHRRDCLALSIGYRTPKPEIMIQSPQDHPRPATQAPAGELSRDQAPPIPPDAANSLPGALAAISELTPLRDAVDALTRRRIEEYHPQVTNLIELSGLSWIDLARLPGVGPERVRGCVLALGRAGLALRNGPEDASWVWRRSDGAIDWPKSCAAWLHLVLDTGNTSTSLRSLAMTIEQEQSRARTGRSPWHSLLEPKPKRRRAAGAEGDS